MASICIERASVLIALSSGLLITSPYRPAPGGRRTAIRLTICWAEPLNMEIGVTFYIHSLERVLITPTVKLASYDHDGFR